MADIFVFGNYAAVVANMANRGFHVPNVVSEESKTGFSEKKSFRLYGLKLFAKTKVNLSFGLKPDFRSGLSFGLNR